MMEIPNWQFAPDFYKYLVEFLTKSTNYKLEGNYEAAFICLQDIYMGISEIIKVIDKELYGKIEEKKKEARKAQDNFYNITLNGEIEEGYRVTRLAIENRKLEYAIDDFHELMMKGAYISNLLIPKKENDRQSGIEKFRSKYIKQEATDNDDMDTESSS